MLHKVARTYGKWPHEFLDLSFEQQNLAVLCVLEHDAAVAHAVKRGKTPVFPTVSLSDVL